VDASTWLAPLESGRLVRCSLALALGVTSCSGAQGPDLPRAQSAAAHDAGAATPVGVTRLHALPLDTAAKDALREAVGNSRVVLLGESSHGAGNEMAWRAAIVELLHRDLGFRHLVMESSFYDCRRAFAEARGHRDPARLGRECAFDAWAEAREAGPLWELVTQQMDTAAPLSLWGMDPQLSGDVSSWLRDDLERLAQQLLDHHDAALLERTLLATRDDEVSRTKEGRARGQALLAAIRRAFDEAPGAGVELPSEDRGFWSNVLDSLIATEEDYWLYQMAEGQIDPTQHNLRERQMADNLLYLLERFPDDRFVVWLHNAHAARHLDEVGFVDHGDHTHDFSQSVTLGGLLSDALEPDPLIVAMFAAEGRYAVAGRDKSGEVPPQPPGSLSDRLAGAGVERALIDLRRAPEAWPWLGEPLSGTILGPEPTTASWARHADVLIYERTMTPATTLD
jgi:erythromycin esterase